jgi:DNA-binding XRE family transcriptional regulator
MSTLGEKIITARKRKSMTQTELGASVGLAQNAISNIENDCLKGLPTLLH